MIYQALEIIKSELQNYIEPFLKGKGDEVVLGNIAFLDFPLNGNELGSKLYQKIVLNLVKISEEGTLKNLPHYEITGQKTTYKNPPVVLNLCLLITTGTHMESYFETSLIYLSHIIRFFQGKHVFTNRNTATALEDDHGELEQFKLIMDMYSPSFEEANYIWSTLGGRQLPHVCYKIRLIELERGLKQEERGVVEEVLSES